MDSKKIIIITAIVILVLGLIIGIFLLCHGVNLNKNQATPNMQNDPIEIDSTIQRVSKKNNFYMVKSCVDKFYTYYESIYNEENDNYVIDEEAKESIEKQQKTDVKAVYGMLDEDYINYKNITLENLTSKLSKINAASVTITDMYESQMNENIYVYFVYGNIRDIKTSKTSDFSMIVKIDMKNRAYKVLLKDYVEEKYNTIQTGIGERLEINVPNEIKAEEYNIFDYKSISDSTYVADIINAYKNSMMFNPEEVYNILDSEYKEKRFKDLESFKKYALAKTKEVVTLKVEKYQSEKYEEYVQYVCLDNKGKYIIIRESAPMKYSLILDTYSIDLPEFKTKYENANGTTKVAFNMDKIKDAINDNNYEYVYSKLNEVFKNDNFKTYSKFIKDFEPRFFEENTFKYKNVEGESKVYTIEVLVKNKKDESSEGKNITFVMQLLEDTNFEISYSME